MYRRKHVVLHEGKKLQINMTGTLIDFVYWQPMQNVGLLRMMSQQDLIHLHVFTTINEYMGFVYRVSSTVRGRRHLCMEGLGQFPLSINFLLLVPEPSKRSFKLTSWCTLTVIILSFFAFSKIIRVCYALLEYMFSK